AFFRPHAGPGDAAELHVAAEDEGRAETDDNSITGTCVLNSEASRVEDDAGILHRQNMIARHREYDVGRGRVVALDGDLAGAHLRRGLVERARIGAVSYLY